MSTLPLLSRLRSGALQAAVAGVLLAGLPAGAQPAAGSAGSAAERGISEWLLRLHEAARQRAYIGTFVVTAEGGAQSSARIWHICDGSQQIERVESLTGTPRSTFRRNDQVVTFLPASRVARTERRETLGLFPNLLKTGEHAIAEFYSVRTLAGERVAGHESDVVQVIPRDAMRFGYRIWSEKKTGLVMKLQTLAADGRVLEQAAFSELQIDAPVRMDKLAQMMAQTDGYRLEKTELVRTTAAAEGWHLRQSVPGFRPVACYRRPSGATDATVQWTFSDGLASVSLFVEPFERQRHTQEGVLALGATTTVTRRIQDWWLTAVGEVPVATLQAFAEGLERRR